MNSISVIICAYNYARFLPRCLNSVLAQSLPANEVIVVDDGSTDKTPDVVACFPSVRYIRQPNAGKAAAFNRGFEASAGEMICHLDADDYWLPNKLEQVAEIFANTNSGGLTHHAFYVDGAENPLPNPARNASDPDATFHLSLQDVANSFFLYPPGNLLRKDLGVANTICVRRSRVSDLLPFPENLGLSVDGALILASSRSGLTCIPEKLSAYRHHQNNYFVRDLSTRKFQSHLYAWFAEIVNRESLIDEGLWRALFLETEAHSSMLMGIRPVASAFQSVKLLGILAKHGIAPNWKHYGLPLACLVKWGRTRSMLTGAYSS
jgi:glycosyltransferase involved in cell wall biosynthesis